VMTMLAVARALKLIGLHPSVVGVEVSKTGPDGTVAVIVAIKTQLWAAWRVAGESPSGVREIEPVTLTFSQAYPTLAPKIALRQDFRRDHPHLMPGAADKPPEPCIVDGRVSELVELRGIQGLIEQLVVWLERAAMGALIDRSQGWEPIRRDGVDDWLVIDGDNMRALADTADGVRLVQTVFSSLDVGATRCYCIDHRSLDPVDANKTRIHWDAISEGHLMGMATGIIAWAPIMAGNEAPVVDTYAPETVVTLGDLRARGYDYGCGPQLDAVINQIAMRLYSTEKFQPTPLAVTFLVRRPCDVIGTTSPIEICAYVVDVRSKDDLIREDLPIVRLCALRDCLSLPILRRASGEDETPGHSFWTLLGCGSVGSKIALHMARRGQGPSCVLDNGFMSPHNYARHALLPDPVDSRLIYMKATALADALALLQQRPKHIETDAITLCTTPEGRSKLAADGGLLHTTASTFLRERLAFMDWEERPVIGEAHLLGAGRVAYAAFEGSNGNPNISDLAVESYRLIAQTSALANIVFSAEAEAIAVGQGCSAFTFPMPDDRLSALTAGLSAAVAQRHFPSCAQDGEIRLGFLGDDGLSQTWTREVVPPWVIVDDEKSGSLGVRLSARVDAAIRVEIAGRPGVETGGVLVGRFSPATNVFQVVDVLPAPPDSTFAAEKFVLGTEGLCAAIEHVVRSSHGAVYVVGTWHNHLGDFGPSLLDVQTALGLALKQFFPVLMLIAKPEGYAFVTAETFNSELLTPPRDASAEPDEDRPSEKGDGDDA
jgi:Prokaryotic E2 family A